MPRHGCRHLSDEGGERIALGAGRDGFDGIADGLHDQPTHVVDGRASVEAIVDGSSGGGFKLGNEAGGPGQLGQCVANERLQRGNRRSSVQALQRCGQRATEALQSTSGSGHDIVHGGQGQRL